MTTATYQEKGLSTHTARPPLVTRPLLLRFAVTLGASISFYLLLSVVPLYAAAAGAGGNAAGLATGALMFSTVAGELVTARLTARYGYRLTLAAGLILLGAPALALTGPANLTVVMAVCIVRGLGFAVTVVAGGAITASLIPAERRGEGLALAGVVSGIPALAALPLGVWLAGRIGTAPVFAAGAVAALAAVAAVPGLPGGRPARPARRGRSARAAAGREPGTGPPLGIVAALRTAALLRPAVVFAAITIAAGIIVTFVPLAVTGSASVAVLALFAQSAAATLSRCLAGWYGDRHGPARLLIPGLVSASLGMLLLALTAVPAVLIAGSLVFGLGFGVAQNASLSLMYERVPASGYDAVSALWNLSYDGGMGLGAAGFGLVAGFTGYPVAFAAVAAAMLIALFPARRDRVTGHSWRPVTCSPSITPSPASQNPATSGTPGR
ncbi:MAG TPA: MFS transporter [Streptosporangiaceae bacterium]